MPTARYRITTPVLWVMGYVLMVMILGVASLSQPVPNPVPGPHDIYYVNATFHYLLSLGVIFSIFAAFYHWFEKMFRVSYRELLGQIHFWVFFLGVNLVFSPQLALRQLALASLNLEAFAAWNRAASIGYAIAVASFGVFLLVIVEAVVRRRRRPSG